MLVMPTRKTDGVATPGLSGEAIDVNSLAVGHELLQPPPQSVGHHRGDGKPDVIGPAVVVPQQITLDSPIAQLPPLPLRAGLDAGDFIRRWLPLQVQVEINDPFPSGPVRRGVRADSGIAPEVLAEQLGVDVALDRLPLPPDPFDMPAHGKEAFQKA